ncbi:hypothetical protein CHUAL_007934 [Chamberlinius hualienensis]
MVFIQNGPVSFSNPNFHLEDAVNCNSSSVGGSDDFNQLYQQLDSVCHFKQQEQQTRTSSVVRNRRNYANLDIGSMGVNNNVNATDNAVDLVRQHQTPVNNLTEHSTIYVDDLNRNESEDNSKMTMVRMTRSGSCSDVSDDLRCEKANSLLSDTGNEFVGYYINVEGCWNHPAVHHSRTSSNKNQNNQQQEEEEDGTKISTTNSDCSPDSIGGQRTLELNSPEDEEEEEEEDEEESERKAMLSGSSTRRTTNNIQHNNNINNEEKVALRRDRCVDDDEEEDEDEEVENPVIPHIQGQLNNDLYAVLVKKNKQSSSSSIASSNKTDEKEIISSPEKLPHGWEKHEDNDGPYYWHIKSGTIQREPPPPDPPGGYNELKKSTSKDSHLVNSTSCSTLSSSIGNVAFPITESNQAKDNYKRKSYPRVEEDSRDKPIRFAVRSLGWVEIAEEDLTPERSSKAVNKCIIDLSLGRNDILDVVGRWGDGKDLFMDLDDHSLKLIDPENLTVLNNQPIHTIRVWGVGRDNGRDFAYVARDRISRKHMCHVFRCDTPARTIANTLRDICKKIMIERSLAQSFASKSSSYIPSTSSSSLSTFSSSTRQLMRPTNLPTEHRRIHGRGTSTYSAQSFPTPMEEPKKVLKVHYLGSVPANKALGMDILNASIDQLVSSVPMEKWRIVNVSIAPSTIAICEYGDDGKVLVECRVRFLSFLGIGKNVKHCAFIVHTGQDQFVAHVFYCEPSSGALCKTIEAACKLRYQKCLDSHPPGSDRRHGDSHGGKGLGATIKTMLGSLTGKRSSKCEDT